EIAQRLEVGYVLAPSDGGIARDGRPATTALVVIEESAAEREPVVLGKQVVVVGAGTAVQHHDRRAVSDASRVDADAVQFDRRLVHRVSNYTVRVAMKLMRFSPPLSRAGGRDLEVSGCATCADFAARRMH